MCESDSNFSSYCHTHIDGVDDAYAFNHYWRAMKVQYDMRESAAISVLIVINIPMYKNMS